MTVNVVPQSVEILSITPDSDKLIEKAGRVCYQSESDGDTNAFISRLINSGHLSVLEHASATFRIVTDRGIMAEITRHRLASYSIESSRFCDYSKDKFGNKISVIKPPKLTDKEYKAWETGVRNASDSYFAMLNAGSKPQIARSVLPMSLKTEMIMTANFREWRLFIQQRTMSNAHPQIRRITEDLRDELDKRSCCFRDLCTSVD